MLVISYFEKEKKQFDLVLPRFLRESSYKLTSFYFLRMCTLQTFDLSQSKLWGILKWVKATLKEKLNRAQCSEPVKSKVPSIKFL